MARIKIVDEQNASEEQLALFQNVRSFYGYLPGVIKILAAHDGLQPVLDVYQTLQFREDSPLSRLQREMVATVVNGLIGGAP